VSSEIDYLCLQAENSRKDEDCVDSGSSLPQRGSRSTRRKEAYTQCQKASMGRPYFDAIELAKNSTEGLDQSSKQLLEGSA